MLHRLTERIKTGHIPFYWDERDDLLKMKEAQYKNISNRLGKILKEIIKGIEKNPYIIAEKLCKFVSEDNKTVSKTGTKLFRLLFQLQ